jgi:hypothetical protein
MGIMPPDRELKWQKLFRRIGIPTDKASDANGDSAPRQDKLPNPADSLLPDVLLPDEKAEKQPRR